MKFIIFPLLLLIALITLPSCSTESDSKEPIESGFLKLFGGSGYDVAKSATKTYDNGIAITGYTTSDDGDFSGLNLGIEDIFVIKMNSSGRTQWIKTFGGSKWNVGNSIAGTSDGGMILAGLTGSNDGIFSDLNEEGYNSFVIKINDSGNIQWVRTFFGNHADHANEIIPSRDGGFLLTGTTRSTNGDFVRTTGNSWDIFVIKLNSDGNTEWTKLYGGSGADEGYSVSETNEGEIFITGLSSSNDGDFEGLNRGFQDIFVMKLNTFGEKLWAKTVGGSGGERATSISITSDNGIIITGRTWSNDGDFINRDSESIFVTKMDQKGSIEWILTLGGSLNEEGLSIIESDDGSYYLTGWSESIDGDFSNMNSGAEDIFVAKLSTTGEIVWIKTFGGSGFERGKSIISMNGDRVVITGWTDSDDGHFSKNPSSNSNIFVIKLDSDGNISN